MSNTIDTIPAGWYPDTERPGGQRYWDGKQWTEHRIAPAGGPVAVGNQAPVQQVAVSPTVVVQDRKRVNHLLHFFLTIITVGLWLPVWIILAIAKS